MEQCFFHLAFIGPGVMAEAMIAGLIRQGVVSADAIVASGPSACNAASTADWGRMQINRPSLLMLFIQNKQ